MPYDPEKGKQYRKTYEDKHPERIRASQVQYRETHKEEIKAKGRRYAKWRRETYPEKVKANKAKSNGKHSAEISANKRHGRQLAKIAVFEAYGGAVCACCGEKHLEFLSIDHINGGGTEHRRNIWKGSGFYSWLKQQGYPLGFRVLCFNCNLALGFFGYCPHQSRAA